MWSIPNQVVQESPLLENIIAVLNCQWGKMWFELHRTPNGLFRHF